MRIAVLSFAHVHAEGYLAVLKSRDDLEVVGCDPGEDGPDRGRSLADRVGVDYLATRDELVAWQPDAVVVTSENRHHRRDVEWAAGHGYHVLCEKPLATTVDDGRAMVAACESAGVQLMVAYPARFSPAFVELATAARQGALGKVLAALGSNNGKSPVAVRPWFGDQELAGGGAIMDHTVHLADLLDVLLDGAAATEVYAAANRIHGADRHNVETGGVVSVGYPGGVHATIECGWTHPAASPTWGGLDLTLIGDQAIVEFDAFPLLASGFGDDTGIALPGAVDLDALMVDEFVQAIGDHRPPQPDGWAGLRNLGIVDAAYRSWQSGQTVAVDPRVVTR